MWACVVVLVACNCMGNQKHVRGTDLQEMAHERIQQGLQPTSTLFWIFQFRGILL